MTHQCVLRFHHNLVSEYNYLVSKISIRLYFNMKHPLYILNQFPAVHFCFVFFNLISYFMLNLILLCHVNCHAYVDHFSLLYKCYIVCSGVLKSCVVMCVCFM